MDTSEAALTRKESKHLHSHLSKTKTVLKQNDLIKKIMPRMGSYSLPRVNNTTPHTIDDAPDVHRQAHSNKNYHNSELKDELLINDHIVLNSAERLEDKSEKSAKKEENQTSNETNSNLKAGNYQNKKINSHEVRKSPKQTVDVNKKKSSTQYSTTTSSNANDTSKFNVSEIDLSLIDFPKKKTILGVPLIFFTYTSAIYSLLAYGATSLLTIIELMMNNSTKLIPLYILLVGYLLITLMSFLLIVAIQREMLNLILFWIIVITVFILPEIGLNVVLAENSFDWFNTASGFYTLVALVVRVTLDIPSIIVILIYHLNRTKRNNYLRKMMLPLKKNIVNGEMLKKYNNLKIDQLINVQYPIIETMPTAEFYLKHYGGNQSLADNSTDIGFEKIRKEITPPPAPTPTPTGTTSRNKSKKIANEQKVTDNTTAIVATPVDTLQNSESKKNVLHYKFANDSDFDVIVRPSTNGQFVQRFVNVDKVKVDRKIPRNTPNVQIDAFNESKTPRKKLLLIKTDITDKSEIKHSNFTSNYNNTDFYQSTKSLDQPVEQPLMVEKTRTTSGKYSYPNVFFDRNNNNIDIPTDMANAAQVRIPINRADQGPDDSFDEGNQANVAYTNGDLHEKYLHMIENRSRMLNVNKHQIYLPPVTTSGMMSEMTKQESNYNLERSFLRQNYPEIVECGGSGTFLSAVDHHYHNTDDRCMFFQSQEQDRDEVSDEDEDYERQHQSAPAAIVNISPCCNCVNIASCSKDKLDEFLHSKDCHLSRQPSQFQFHFKSSYPNLLTQRKHF